MAFMYLLALVAPRVCFLKINWGSDCYSSKIKEYMGWIVF